MRHVHPTVLRQGHELEIFNVVVAPIVIDMMNDFPALSIPTEWAIEVLLHHNTMLELILFRSARDELFYVPLCVFRDPTLPVVMLRSPPVRLRFSSQGIGDFLPDYRSLKLRPVSWIGLFDCR